MFKEYKRPKAKRYRITESHKDIIRWLIKGGETQNQICLFTRLKLTNRDIKKILAEPTRYELESELNFIKSENGYL